MFNYSSINHRESIPRKNWSKQCSIVNIYACEYVKSVPTKNLPLYLLVYFYTIVPTKNENNTYLRITLEQHNILKNCHCLDQKISEHGNEPFNIYNMRIYMHSLKTNKWFNFMHLPVHLYVHIKQMKGLQWCCPLPWL